MWKKEMEETEDTFLVVICLHWHESVSMYVCVRSRGNHARSAEFFCDTGSGDVIVYYPKAFSHTHCLPLCVSHTLMYLPLSLRDLPSPTIIWVLWLWLWSLSSLVETNTHSQTHLWSMELAGRKPCNPLKCKTDFKRIHTADLCPWIDSLCLCKVTQIAQFHHRNL